MVGFLLGIGLCAVTFSYCMWHDNPKRITNNTGKCCDDSFCDEDCGGWGA